MDIRILKFAPLAVAGLFTFKELLSLVVTFRFDLIYYLFPDGLYFDPIQVIYLFILLLKVAFILGLLYQFKLFTESKITHVKIAAGAVAGIYVFRGLTTTLVWGRSDRGFVTFVGILVFLAVIANLVLALITNDPNTPQRPSQQFQFRSPVQFQQQPMQNFGGQPGQSIPDQLAALQALVDAGTLSQAEFIAAKQRIIGS
jgi:hypothetical protein